MLFIVIVAFIATVGFFRRATEIGIHPGKAASVPFIALGVMLAVTHLSAVVLGCLFAAMNASSETARWLGFSMDWFLVFAYLFFIKRNWDILSSANCRNPALDAHTTNADSTH